MSVRGKGRAIALQLLYQSDWNTIKDVDEAITDYSRNLAEKPLPEGNPALAFARTRIEGVLGYKMELDAIIGRHSRRWRLERMSAVDRNILRLGVFELCHCEDIPPRVAINEAVELAKKFGSDESPAFVNGILDSIMRDEECAEKVGQS